MLFVVLLPAAVFFFLSGQKMVCLAVRVQTKVQTKVQRKVQTKVGKIRRADILHAASKSEKSTRGTEGFNPNVISELKDNAKHHNGPSHRGAEGFNPNAISLFKHWDEDINAKSKTQPSVTGTEGMNTSVLKF